MTATMMAIALATCAAEDPPKSKKRQSVEDVFKKLDKNDDRKVSLEEFKAFPAIKNKDAAGKAFKSADTNEDGSLSLDEFRDWAERMAERSRDK